MSLEKAKEVMRIEAAAIKALAEKLDERFMKVIDFIANCQGRVVVTGMGKTGLIGRKMAATFSSTGTPSIFLHSAEAVHGDLGQVTKDDVVIIISNSGETEETVRLVPFLKRMNSKMIAMTGNSESSLAKHCDVVLDVGVDQEGCPLGLAPMASTTATLVMGDALAACLVVRKQFKKEDFAVFHPGGDLGRRLLLRVEDVMRKGSVFAKVSETTLLKDVLLAITKARCGSACVVGVNDTLIGIFTDGDLRRHLDKSEDILNKEVQQFMTKNPMIVSQTKLVAEALEILKKQNIDEVPVVNDEGVLVGLLDIQDILKTESL